MLNQINIRKLDVLALWGVIRLPLLAIGLYLFREEFVSLIERFIGLPDPTQWAVYFISTLPERILLFFLCSIILGASVFLAKKLRSPSLQYFLPLVCSFILFLALINLTPGFNSKITLKDIVFSLIFTSFLALNTLPNENLISFLTNTPGRLISNILFTVAIGISEILLFKPFLLWLLSRIQGRDVVITGIRRFIVGWLPILVMVPALVVLPLSSKNLIKFSRILHNDKAVQMFTEGGLNWLALNKEQSLLYVSGNTINRLLAFDINALEKPPQKSQVDTGKAQAFAYNSLANELYIHNPKTNELLFLNATNLELVKSIKTPFVAPGDSWIVWDNFSDNIFIVSEADEQKGVPFVVVNRTTGNIVEKLQLNPSNIMLHPAQPLLYMGSFRRPSELLIYDTQRLHIVKRIRTSVRLNRLAFADRNNELLVASPLNSAVLKYDAETLASKGAIKTVLGVRSIAVDRSRNLLLSGSLATNTLEVINLTTQKSIAKYYVGPWLRTICLDTDEGIAYVSTNGGVFKVQYLARVKL